MKQFNGSALVTDISKSMAKNGRPYLKMNLSLESGKQYNAIMFNSDMLGFEVNKGDVISIQGSIEEFNGNKQLKIITMEPSKESSDKFLSKSKFNPEVMLEDIKTILYDNIQTDYFVKYLDNLFGDAELVEKLKKSSAAKSMHHAFSGGLIEHIRSMLKIAVMVSNHYLEYYGEKSLNKELLLIGVLMHDIGKTEELSSSVGFGYTDIGSLVGHIPIGSEMVEKYALNSGMPEKAKVLIKHLILSHHGSLEFGSPILPKTIEAMILSFLDDLDAKVNSIQMLFKNSNIETGEWTGYDRLLGRPFYLNNQGE